MTDCALTVREAASVLKIRTHGVLSLIHSGELRGVDVSLTPGGRPRWRILQEDLEAFVTRRTHETQAPRRRRRKLRTNVMQYF